MHMKIKSNLKDYEVVFEDSNIFFRELLATRDAKFIIDKNVYQLYEKEFQGVSKEKLLLLEANEENKVIETALSICEQIIAISAKRNTTLISIGGGIIQDITGFVANIMYRGIHWIFVPTTLLAACDSCIGGKTSLNYKRYKNLLGTIYPPDKIYIYPQLFQTLTLRDYKSGLGEVVKFNIMAGEKGLEEIETSLDALLRREPLVINYFVEKSLLFKKNFIEQDEFDRGERIKLNFAHTFGHAIEAVSNYEIPHGTAVAIGMIMANRISNSRKWIENPIVKRSEALLLKVIDIDITLLERPISDYMDAIRKDKKQTNDSLTAVLIKKYGYDAELQVVHDVSQKEIEDAINYFISIYKDKK